MSENKKFEYMPGQKGKDIATYLYQDASGEVLFRKVKTLTGDPERPKMFRFERLIDRKWVTGMGILNGVKRVPFKLPKLIKNSSVIITEGEKDVDNLASLHFSATCCHCGAGSWPLEITPYFDGKLVYILYDIDTRYRKKLPEMVAANLWGTARDIRIIDLEPFFPARMDLLSIHEKDVSDYLIRFPGQPAKISSVHELLRQARIYTPPEIC
jgi:putative DNA primase/helicase